MQDVWAKAYVPSTSVRNSSGISGGFRQLWKYDSDVIYRNLRVCDAARMNMNGIYIHIGNGSFFKVGGEI